MLHVWSIKKIKLTLSVVLSQLSKGKVRDIVNLKLRKLDSSKFRLLVIKTFFINYNVE